MDEARGVRENSAWKRTINLGLSQIYVSGVSPKLAEYVFTVLDKPDTPKPHYRINSAKLKSVAKLKPGAVETSSRCLETSNRNTEMSTQSLEFTIQGF